MRHWAGNSIEQQPEENNYLQSTHEQNKQVAKSLIIQDYMSDFGAASYFNYSILKYYASNILQMQIY